MASQNFALKNQPCNRLYPKKPAGMHWLGYNDAVSWLTNRKHEYFSLQPILKFSKFTCISSACLPAFLPACHKTRCARCRAPEISHNKGNGGGFTKMLFRRRFTHCAMTIPFILLSLSLFFFIPLTRCESHLRR